MTDEKPLEDDHSGTSVPLNPEEIAKREKAEELNNWALFDVHKWSDYPEVNEAVNEIYRVLKTDPKFSGSDRIRKKHVKVIVLDLYAKWLVDPKRYVGLYRRESEYRAKSRYNAIHISKMTPEIVDALERHGYLEQIKGHYGRTPGHSSHLTRIRATQKLLDLTKRKGWTPNVVQLARDRECIELRVYDPVKDQQVTEEYTDTPETECMRKELTAYNNLIRDAHIDVLGYPKEGINKTVKIRGKVQTWTQRIDLQDKFTRRIFNNGTWENGGRFYGGWWQRIPNSAANGQWRQRIYIMGKPTVEVDYSGLHIVLLYAEKGIDYWAQDGKDPYSLPGYDDSPDLRALLKLIVLIAVNVTKPTPGKQRTAALAAIRSEINSPDSGFEWVREQNINVEEILDDFMTRHAPIASAFFTGAGKRLQLLDSRIAEYVINHMTSEHHPVLAIHDSFICEEPLYPALLKHVEDGFSAVIRDIYPGLGHMKPKVKFTAPNGGKSSTYVSLWERDRDEFERLDMVDPKADKEFWGRFEDYDVTQWESAHDYYKPEEIKYEVPEDEEK